MEDLGGQKILDTIEGMKIDLSHVEEEHDHCCDHEHHHDHDHEEHEHHHDHEDHDHDDHEHHHDHGEGCTCGCHDHDHDDHEHHHDHDHDDHEHHHDHGEGCTCGCHDHDHEGHHHHHHHADEVFTSWGKETVRKYSREEIEKILKTLSEEDSYGMILRAKGMLESEDGVWTYFDMVPEEVDIREGSAEYTGRICVIGSKLDEAKLEQLWFAK